MRNIQDLLAMNENIRLIPNIYGMYQRNKANNLPNMRTTCDIAAVKSVLNVQQTPGGLGNDERV